MVKSFSNIFHSWSVTIVDCKTNTISYFSKKFDVLHPAVCLLILIFRYWFLLDLQFIFSKFYIKSKTVDDILFLSSSFTFLSCCVFVPFYFSERDARFRILVFSKERKKKKKAHKIPNNIRELLCFTFYLERQESPFLLLVPCFL